MGKDLELAPLPTETVGVFGAASRFTEAQVVAAYRAGREVARLGKCLVTGATTGVPLAAAIGAKSLGGLVVGLSPADSPKEHVGRFRRPLTYHDMIVYSGLGVEGRQPLAVRSSRGAIFIGGEFGTLAEFSVAWTVGDNVLGIMQGAGGLADDFVELTRKVQSNYGSLLLSDDDPIRLVRRVCAEVDARYPVGQLATGPHDAVETLTAVLRGAGVLPDCSD